MSSIIKAIEAEDVPSVELAAAAAAVLDETTLEFSTPEPTPEPEPAPELEPNRVAAAAAIAGDAVGDFIVAVWEARDILARVMAADPVASASLSAATRLTRAVIDGNEQAARAASSAMSEFFVVQTVSAPAGAPPAPAAPAAPAADYMTPVWFALDDGVPRQGVLARDLEADADFGLVMWWDIPATAGTPGIISSVGCHVALLWVANSPAPSSFWF